MEKLPINFRDERELRSNLGVSLKCFWVLLKAFNQTLIAQQQRKYEKQVADGKRKRRPGAGRPSKLRTPTDKLIFGLYYLKNYPKFDVLANKYSLSRSVTHDNVMFIVPLIRDALNLLKVLPKREFTSVEEFNEFFKNQNIETILIDVTEREHFRYKEKEKRNALYSGKKKVYYEKFCYL